MEAAHDRDLRAAASALRAGGVIAYPTETFYGLGALTRVPAALTRLWALKERHQRGPLSLLVPPDLPLSELVREPTPSALEALTRRFWPGPLTLVMDARPGLDERLVGPDGGVALRVSSHPLAAALMHLLGEPLTATSANFRGQPPALDAASIRHSELGARLDFVLEGGQTRGDKPSTVLRLRERDAIILREGAVPRAALQSVLAPLDVTLV